MTGPRSALARGLGLLTVLVSTLLVWSLASPAQAHTELEESSPADGSTVRRLPARAELTFSGDVDPADLTVSARGKALPVEQVPGRPKAFRVDLSSLVRSEAVALDWKIIDSHDGHQSGGTVRFRVRGSAGGDATDRSHDATPRKGPAASPRGQPPTDPPAEPSLLGPAEVGARIAGYLAMAVLIGGLLFVSLLWPAGSRETRTRTVLVAAVLVGALAAVAEVAIALWRADGSLTLTAALTEDFGRAYSAMVLLWLLAAVIVVGLVQGGENGVRRLPWRLGALVVAMGLVRVTSMNAHASQGSDPVWGAVADFLHLTAVSAWVGGLVVLTIGLLPRRRLDELEAVVPRFSKVAMVSVLMIVASGLLLVWQVIWPIDGFWATDYSRVLVVKLSLFVLVLLAAMASKRWVDRTVAGASAARRRTAVRSIAASVAAETVLVAAVLGAASVLATSSPGV